MLYLRFSPVALDQWDVLEPVKSAKPIATTTRRNGQLSATITADHTIKSEELSILSVFMREHEAA